MEQSQHDVVLFDFNGILRRQQVTIHRDISSDTGFVPLNDLSDLLDLDASSKEQAIRSVVTSSMTLRKFLPMERVVQLMNTLWV